MLPQADGCLLPSPGKGTSGLFCWRMQPLQVCRTRDVVLQVPVPTLIPPPGVLLPCVPRLSLICGPEFGLGAETGE